ncbi:hypothetical protein HQ571_06060 [Candidatus Kuenenbacteria bacterium]|nr:hypothetical protein [Candidatus Kuenenbacteria bacterium]
MSHTIFSQIISIENLFFAWHEFKRGKRKKPDVQKFEFNLEDNLFKLNWILKTGRYKHGHYQQFSINDPKPRIIHKACVQDRVVHHAVFRVLYPIFDKSFIYDSYSCRINKGTHRAVKKLELFTKNTSRNYQFTCFILKCDIAKFFNTIDHQILIALIEKRIRDNPAMDLIREIIYSYRTIQDKGVPLGNLTSQLFANIYMNEFDQFVKHELKMKRYIRYTDDFVFIHYDEQYLKEIISRSKDFLWNKLKLKFHPEKISICKLNQGIDFLGYVVFPYHTILRTRSKQRMLAKTHKRLMEYNGGRISRVSFNQTIQSYYGMLQHCHGYSNKEFIKNIVKNGCDFS